MITKHKTVFFAAPYFFLAVLVSSPGYSGSDPTGRPCPDCGYFMCQYEKGNIDTIIMEHAKDFRCVMFGEIHDNVCAGSPPPVEDSEYVISLLPGLRKLGYAYLALEVNRDAKKKCHSRDVIAFYQNYRAHHDIHGDAYRAARPGWIKLVRAGMDLGYRIKFIDAPLGGMGGVSSRDSAMFKKIKSEIFEQDEKAKIVVYVGAHHVIEKETYEGVYLHKGKIKPLGLLLDDYTKGKNFSVYMGHPQDTPAKCDLFISYFIWETYDRLNAEP